MGRMSAVGDAEVRLGLALKRFISTSVRDHEFLGRHMRVLNFCS